MNNKLEDIKWRLHEATIGPWEYDVAGVMDPKHPLHGKGPIVRSPEGIIAQGVCTHDGYFLEKVREDMEYLLRIAEAAQEVASDEAMYRQLGTAYDAIEDTTEALERLCDVLAEGREE